MYSCAGCKQLGVGESQLQSQRSQIFIILRTIFWHTMANFLEKGVFKICLLFPNPHFISTTWASYGVVHEKSNCIYVNILEKEIYGKWPGGLKCECKRFGTTYEKLFSNQFLLEYSCFTMLCQFLLHSKVNQLYVYTYPLFLDFFPIQVATEHSVEFPELEQVLVNYLFIYLFIFIIWGLITSQHCSGFCHTLT